MPIGTAPASMATLPWIVALLRRSDFAFQGCSLHSTQRSMHISAEPKGAFVFCESAGPADYTGPVVAQEHRDALSRRPRRSGYLPSLDGWRALAIIAVLMDHDEPWTYKQHTNASFHNYGGWGVYLFFAISGVLVCTRILEDESLTKTFRIGDFYIRRLFRIQPAALAYLAVIGVLSWFGITHERPSALLGGLFLYQNYIINLNDVTGRWFLTGHFWTLAIEEHFYILLSLLLFFFRSWRVLVFAALLALLYLFHRFAIHFSLYSPATSTRHTELNLQYLFVPALFALLLRRKEVLDLTVRYLRPWVAFLGTVMAKQLWFLVHVRFRPHSFLEWFITPSELMFYAFGFWVVATMLHPRSWTTRFLELPPLRYLGRISYSVYLWHALFLVGHAPATGIHTPWLFALTERPWRYLATLAMALLSYYGIEKPLIRLGHRLAPPATPGHRDLEPTPQPFEHTTMSPQSVKAEAG